MQSLEMTSIPDRPLPPAQDGDAKEARFVAVGAVLLKPVDRPEQSATIVNRGAWPIFVIVLDDRAIDDEVAGPLFELLERPHASRIAITHTRFRWSVSRSGDIVTLALQTREPTKIALDIKVPARPLLSILPQLPADAAFAITTKRHADKLTNRVALRDALHEVVLLVNGSTDDGLADLLRCGEREMAGMTQSPGTISQRA